MAKTRACNSIDDDYGDVNQIDAHAILHSNEEYASRMNTISYVIFYAGLWHQTYTK